MSVLTVENLHFSYGRTSVLKGVSMEFYQGTFYGVIGPNGCGKSTLLKNLYGYLTPASGKVCLDGADIRRMKSKERSKHIAYVPQETVSGFDFSVFDIIAMGRNPYHSGLDGLNRVDLDHIESAMQDTSTTALRNKSINELSGGEKQRVILARAFAQDSDIILMDEPVSMLDINHQVEIMDLAKSLADKKNRTIICVLHDLNLTAQYTQHIFLMAGGTVVRSGMPDEVLTEEIITGVYNVDVFVGGNERTGRRIIIPISRL
ncbi:MAG: ABC transporter ATP-binding protein [Clostridia bacterium]